MQKVVNRIGLRYKDMQVYRGWPSVESREIILLRPTVGLGIC
jgi:hypothetical protein